MIRAVIREAWADSPAKVIAAIVAVPIAVFMGWLWFLVIAELLRSLGVPK